MFAIPDTNKGRTPRRGIKPKKRLDKPEAATPVAAAVPRNGPGPNAPPIISLASIMDQGTNAQHGTEGTAATKTSPVVGKTEVMRRVSLQTLIALGIKAPHKIVHFNLAKKLQALVNFNLACHYGHLPLQFGFKQVRAFLEMLEQLNYMAETLKLQWAFFRSVIKLSQFKINERMENGFDFVLANCKPINNDKMPVSKELLKQLLKAADKIFQPYNAVLVKTMFLVAWGGVHENMQIFIHQSTSP